MIDKATVYLDSDTMHGVKVKFKDNGWIGVKQHNSPWQYFPARRVESVESENKGY